MYLYVLSFNGEGAQKELTVCRGLQQTLQPAGHLLLDPLKTATTDVTINYGKCLSCGK